MQAGTMIKHDNPDIALVQELYAAYLRGHIEAIVAATTPDVTFGLDGRPQDFPLLGHRKGADGVQEFFRVLAETQEITDFRTGERIGARPIAGSPKNNSADF
jgi:ketosteroid isomerase-like protein